jgi:hypothetical protein
MPWFMALGGLPYISNASYTNSTLVPDMIQIAPLWQYSFVDYAMRQENGRPTLGRANMEFKTSQIRYSPSTRMFYVQVDDVRDPVFSRQSNWHATAGLGDLSMATVTMTCWPSKYPTNKPEETKTTMHVDRRLLHEFNGDAIPPVIANDTVVRNPAFVMWAFEKEQPPVPGIASDSIWTTHYQIGACPYALDFYMEETKMSGLCYWTLRKQAMPSLILERRWGKVGSHRSPSSSTKRSCQHLGREVYKMLRDKLTLKHYTALDENRKPYLGVVVQQNSAPVPVTTMTRLLTTLPTGRSLVRVEG